jgi:dienelactone hydrolase
VRTHVTTLAGQGANVSFPNRTSTGRLVIFVHGGGLDYEFATVMPSLGSQAYTRIQELIDYLTFRGYVVVCPALLDTSLGALTQGDHFGNDASTTQLASVITAAKALPNVSQGKYGLIGFSSACLTVANHARRVSSAGIAGMLSLCPAFNISFYRGRDAAQGSAYANVNAAHGVANDAAWDLKVPTFEPAAIAPSIAVPWGLWSSSNDPAAPPSQSATAPASQVGLTASGIAALVPGGKGSWRDMGATNTGVNLGHNTVLVEPKDVQDFLETWAW